MNPKKILIIQLRRVGDVLFTLPAAGALRRAFTQAQIDFLVEKPADAFVRLNPHVNETMVYDKNQGLAAIGRVRGRGYDWVLDFHSNGRTWVLSLLSGAQVKAALAGPAWRRLIYTHCIPTSLDKYLVEQKLDVLRGLGVPVRDWSWDIGIPEPEKIWASQFFQKSGPSGSTWVAIAPATRRQPRAWPLERFAQVADFLRARSVNVLFLWGPGEEHLVQSIAAKLEPSLPGRAVIPPLTTLLQLGALIRECSLVVSLDNGPKNLAVALNIPTLTLHGPTNPLSFNPHGNRRHAVVQDSVMENIRAETVINKITEMMNPKEMAWTK